MGLRVNPDQFDPTLFAPPARDEAPRGNEGDDPFAPTDPTGATAGATASQEVDEAEEAAEDQATEEAENNRAQTPTVGPGGGNGPQQPGFGPTVPGGNLDITA